MSKRSFGALVVAIADIEQSREARGSYSWLTKIAP
jgi:hypothetical protein